MELRILLIEDDPEIAGLVQLHLRDEGYAVEHAASGDDGLRRAQQGGWALVILDLMLPVLDGLEVCKALREKKKGLPILMLTAR